MKGVVYMKLKNVVVAGGGVLGSQIAFQSAYCGANVTIWLRSEGSIGRTQPKLDNLKKTYIKAIEDMANGTGDWCPVLPTAIILTRRLASKRSKKRTAPLNLNSI